MMKEVGEGRMKENIQAVIKEVAGKFSDTREQLLDVEIQSLEDGKLILQGRVLDDATLATLCSALQAAQPELALETKSVRVLRQPKAKVLTVNTNLTGFYDEPSFHSESLSEQMYGWQLEVLEEKDSWSFVRQEDGYMGWVYTPYMREGAPVPPTHVAMTPVAQLRAKPHSDALPVGRLLGGASVAVLAVEGEWAMVDCDHPGWVPLAGLRAFSDMPRTEEERRAAMVKDVIPMLGVPYQWGGCSANGIDCSGLAQLLHRWVGITTRRDAGMQFVDGKEIEAPFAPGDLVFFGDVDETSGKHSITHVGISVDGWKIVHSSRSRNGVYYDDVQAVEPLRSRYLCACTYIG
jgi:gamma-D-glutamyl-L-lysine dipeptidyl-peptidase